MRWRGRFRCTLEWRRRGRFPSSDAAGLVEITIELRNGDIFPRTHSSLSSSSSVGSVAVFAPGLTSLVLAEATAPAFRASAPLALVFTKPLPTALPATVSLALVLADACPPAIFAPAPHALMRADAGPPAFFTAAPNAPMLAEAGSTTFFTLAMLAEVHTEALAPALSALPPHLEVHTEPPTLALFASAALAVVLADALPAAFFTPEPLAIVFATRALPARRRLHTLSVLPPALLDLVRRHSLATAVAAGGAGVRRAADRAAEGCRAARLGHACNLQGHLRSQVLNRALVLGVLPALLLEHAHQVLG